MDSIRTYDYFAGKKLATRKQIEIEETPGGDKVITIIAPLYLNKRLKVPFCFSGSWTDEAILRDHDLGTFLINRYGEY